MADSLHLVVTRGDGTIVEITALLQPGSTVMLVPSLFPRVEPEPSEPENTEENQ